MTTTVMPCAFPDLQTSNVSSSITDTNTATIENDKNWLNAVETLAKFAAMDTAQYASMLVTSEEQRRRIQKSQAQNNPHANDQNYLMLQIENLRKDGAFEETPIPDLVRAIHRFHSNLALWHHQDAQHAHEMRQLQSALLKSQSREYKLSQECKKLKNQTTRLRTKLQEKRNVLAQARLWFEKSVAERESLQELATAAQLQVHEHLMTLPGRIRLGSTESNFSDVDALDFVEREHSAETETDTEYTNASSIREIESRSSLITDESIATLHYKPDESLPRIAATSSSYTLEFRSGVKTGMRVKAVPVTEWIPLAKPALSLSNLDGSPHCVLSDAHEEISDNSIDAVAFVVCGHHRVDSDDEENVTPRVALPPIGARIVAVRDRKIGSAWSITEVLGAMSNTDDEEPTFRVTFRNGRIKKSKQQQKSLTLTANLSDEESSQGEDRKGEVSTEQPRNSRPFNLFGVKNATKLKDSQVTAEQDSKPAPQKGNGNPLIFWRNEEMIVHGEIQQQDNFGDFSSKGDVNETSKDPDQVSESTHESELRKEERTNKGHGNNPLMFWKKDDSEPRLIKNNADSFFSRQRKNTADSVAYTEATMISKEDSSITSCSESKGDECNLTSVTEDASVNKITPMNHLMFWRKTELSDDTEDIPKVIQEVSHQVEMAQSESATSEELPVNQKLSERSSFRMPFWNPQACQTQPTNQAGPTEMTLAAEQHPTYPDAQAKSIKDLSNESMGVCESESFPTDNKKDSVEESRGNMEQSNIFHSEEKKGTAAKNSQTPDTRAEVLKEKTWHVKSNTEAGTLATERSEEASVDQTTEAVDSGPKIDREEPPVKDHDGPMKQMGRFFSKPFVN